MILEKKKSNITAACQKNHGLMNWKHISQMKDHIGW